MTHVVKKVFHMFGAIGGGAKGFKRARVQLGGVTGQWECVGSVDVDAAANRVFAARVGVPATTLDLADRAQYIAIHGREPPAGWREAVPDDIRRAANGHRPDCIFLSAPCKGFSGLLSEAKSGTSKYQAMNGLAERGLFLALEAWADDPVPLILFENVPRLLSSRGRAFADQLIRMMQSFGYATAETVHDCGKLGRLAQSRKRCLIVARHMAKVPNFLYEPPQHPLRAVGDVLGKMWLPGDEVAGPMHRVPQLQWKTWVRLAFVEAGSDWRSLNKLAVEDGVLRDYLLVPEMHNGGYGVRGWEESTGVVASESRPSNGAFSVADPRSPVGAAEYQQYGVLPWKRSAGAVINVKSPGQGTYSVADPRHGGPAKHSNEFRIVRWGSHSMAVTGAHGSGQAVADPRPRPGPLFSKYPIAAWGGSSGTVIGGDDTGAYGVADPRPGWEGRYGNLSVADWDEASRCVVAGGKGVQGGWLSVADPRTGMDGEREAYLTGGHYGVLRMGDTAGAVAAAACHDNGRWSVADHRMPVATDKLVARIRALDGTWHRPFTTLELAALQSLFDPEDPADCAAFSVACVEVSKSDGTHREWIGNAVPPEGITPVAEEMLRTLMLADAGETFQLSALPVWVRPVAAAINLAQGA
jgi:site-specific DNA-cytosine methylase